MEQIALLLMEELALNGDTKKAAWLENYVKHDAKSKGVGIPNIRKIVKKYDKEHAISASPVEQQEVFLNSLMASPYTEDKLAAILFVQLFWKDSYEKATLLLVEHWLDQQWISDWNVCDWMCVRLLSPILDRSPLLTMPFLNNWHTATYLWKARSSLVPFASAKTIEKYPDEIQSFAEVLIQREERFCKTVVGWVLRVYSKHNPDFVRSFLDKYQGFTTKEVVRNATKLIS